MRRLFEYYLSYNGLGKYVYLTSLSKIKWWRGRIGLWLEWINVYFKQKDYQLSFGYKLFTIENISLT